MSRQAPSHPRRRNPWTEGWLLVLIAGFVLGACVETRYVAYSDVVEGTEHPYRTVAFDIDRAFYTDFPDCVLIMPASLVKGDGRFATLIEAALGRHLMVKFTRVVDPVERDVAVRRLAADLAQREDRLAVAEAVRCHTFVFTDLLEPRLEYLVFWTQVRVGLEVRMVRAGDGHVLWRARHEATRDEGGLPLSPVGAVVKTFSSTRFANDYEVVESVIDDAVRRLIVSLPNVRDFK